MRFPRVAVLGRHPALLDTRAIADPTGPHRVLIDTS
jgi:hypothetical protein